MGVDACCSDNDSIRNSPLYKQFQAEREEILKHKWIESQKAGHDIGFERALTDWIIYHRSKWRRAYEQEHRNPRDRESALVRAYCAPGV